MTTAKKAPRRTQESRSAATREKLLKAAIDSLYTAGYAATTTTVVAEKAGVSRGAMLHQFPTKVNLMLFVVQAVYEEEVRLYHEILGSILDPEERLRAFPHAVWSILCRPAGVAVLEIMQGSRSDPALSRRLRQLQTKIEKDSLKQAGELLSREGGVSPERARLVVWAVRGLSIARLLTDKPKEIEKSIDLLPDFLVAAIHSEQTGNKPATRPRVRKRPKAS